MSNSVVDVLLISTDEQFRAAVGRHRPSGASLRCVSAEELAGAAVSASQAWVDLDSATAPSLPDSTRRVYFYSDQRSVPEGLPAGIFIRKPCAAAVLDVLWADVRPPHSAVSGTPAHSGGRSLPAWLLEFQELRLATLCRKLITGLAPRLGYRDVSLYLHDPERSLLRLAETTHTRAIELTVPMDAIGQHLMVAVARSGRVFRTEHAADELLVRGIRPHEDRGYEDEACLVAPLRSDGQLWGVLNFSGRVQTALTEADPPLDEIFAFLGGALHHARAYDQARTEARIDSLTGLYNQRWILESLGREIRRAERYGTPLAVLMIDLDGLKGINDRQGHAAGDCVLRHAASRIGRVLRQFDGAARVGGDEFVIMLPATDIRGAQRVARRLLESIRKDVAHYRDIALPITASVGAAEWHQGWDGTQLIEAADRAMYRTKQNGRDNLSCEVTGPEAKSPIKPGQPGPPQGWTDHRATPSP